MGKCTFSQSLGGGLSPPPGICAHCVKPQCFTFAEERVRFETIVGVGEAPPCRGCVYNFGHHLRSEHFLKGLLLHAMGSKCSQGIQQAGTFIEYAGYMVFHGQIGLKCDPENCDRDNPSDSGCRRRRGAFLQPLLVNIIS